MSEQTKKLYRLLPWAVAAGLVIVIGMALSYIRSNLITGGPWFGIDPWLNAHRVASQIAINEFGEGIPDMGFYRSERISALAGILILFIIGPSLWIFSEIKNQTRVVASKDDELKKGFVWYAGAMIVIAGLLMAVPGTVIKGTSFNSKWEIAAKSRNMDHLKSELMTMSFEAAELYYLSHKTGNEGGFQAIPAGDGEIRPIGLKDLESSINTSLNSFVLAPIESDSIITIYGIGHKNGKDPDFKNANGEQGKIQLAVKVIPGGEITQFVNANTNEGF